MKRSVKRFISILLIIWIFCNLAFLLVEGRIQPYESDSFYPMDGFTWTEDYNLAEFAVYALTPAIIFFLVNLFTTKSVRE